MDLKKTKKVLFYLAIAYWLLALMIYVIASPQFHVRSVASETASPVRDIGEFIDGVTVTQQVRIPAQKLDAVAVMAADYGQQNHGRIVLEVMAPDGTCLAAGEADISLAGNWKYLAIPLDAPLMGQKGQVLTLVFSAKGCASGSTITLLHGGQKAQSDAVGVCTVGKKELSDVLCLHLTGTDKINDHAIYLGVVTLLFIACVPVCIKWLSDTKKGKNNPVMMISAMSIRYRFLLSQLVNREFKVKYKRSALGIGWSFFNPLLTMLIQYTVFSTLFKTDLEHYPVYLLTGIVIFNFFSEALNLGMTAITGNASLISKVYVPKYIYVFSKVISSSVNLLLSLIPLFSVVLVSGLKLKPSFLLLIFDFICLITFVIGMALLLSTSMVFFRDTQFLWGIVSMIWMYCTPIFYPITIIPENLLPFFKLNPLYQFITFARTSIISGISPELSAYFACAAPAVLALLLGSVVFKKHQQSFTLYL